jgi:hypothetical protein
MRLPKLGKAPIWLILIIISIAIICIYFLYQYLSPIKEGFYPVNEARIELGNTARHRYNDFADTQDVVRGNVIPEGPQGDSMLERMLRGPTYEGNGQKVSRGPAASVNYDDEFDYLASPQGNLIMARVKKCESYTSWNCGAFEDPEFDKYCGICTSNGQNHIGKPHVGGLYIDSDSKTRTKKMADEAGTKPEYAPTVGICKGEFITSRPHCDIQKDRDDCSKAQSFEDQHVKAKCALCVQSPDENKFVYIGGRAGKEANYALKPAKPVEFKVRLRFGVADATSAKIVVTRNADQKVYKGAFIQGTNVYIVDIDKAYENEKYNILITYPEYRPYNWTTENITRIDSLANPKRAKLVRAAYGPFIGDHTKDDPRAVDVSKYIKEKFNIQDCSKTEVVASNDGLGGDPTYGIYKQLRLVYSDNGSDFVYAFTGEGGKSKPVVDAKFEQLCPVGMSVKDAEKIVCETNLDSSLNGNIYTDGKNDNYRLDDASQATGTAPNKVIFYSACDYGGKATELAYGDYNFARLIAAGYQNDTLQSLKVPDGITVTLWEHDIGGGRPLIVSKDTPCLKAFNYMNTVSSCQMSSSSTGAKCIQQIPKRTRGIVGVWESLGHAPRVVPINHSLVSINGFDVGENGPPTLGTVQGSKYFKTDVPPSKLPNIPNYLFWFWEKNRQSSMCDFTVVVPATLRDTSVLEDTIICPTGPLASTPEAAKRLQAGACEKLGPGGVPQGPGTYSLECVKSLYLASGCTNEGKTYPSNAEKARAITQDSSTGTENDADTFSYALAEMYTIATTAFNFAGLRVEDDTHAKALDDCFGKVVGDPCDTPFKATGPHTVKCLNYLYKNAGKNNPEIGQTYPGVYSRSSGTDRTSKTPTMYCQNKGSMSPVDPKGQPNADAIQAANSYGGIEAVREFYRLMHYNANFSKNVNEQKIALNQCYGVGVKTKTPTCKGTKARYVRVMQSMIVPNAHIQIAQLQVFNVFDTNVALKKPTSCASQWDSSSGPSLAVDGNASSTRQWPIYHDMAQRNWSRATSDEFWQVDLQQEEEIAYIVYYNRFDCCRERSRGMRIQLLDSQGVVVKEKTLVGGTVETVMFSNARPSTLLRTGTELQFAPGRYPGSVISVKSSGEILVSKKEAGNPSFLQSAVFVVVAGNDNTGSTFSFKHKFSNNFLRSQGFRVRASADDNTDAFRRETSFKVSDSISGSPGEVSYESMATANTYLSVAENMGVYISSGKTPAEQRMCSWFIVQSPV